MGVAIVALTVGAWFAYSALKGQSLADVFKGGGSTLDPSGSITVPEALAATGTDPNAPVSVGGVPLSTGGTNADAMDAEQNRMISLRQPYKWGGGHASFSSTGPWDCSGAVSWLMHYMGLLNGSPLTSTGFMTQGKAGRGNVFTIHANPTHVFLYMESGPHRGMCWGTTTRIASQGGSLAWHNHTTAGFVARHYDGW